MISGFERLDARVCLSATLVILTKYLRQITTGRVERRRVASDSMKINNLLEMSLQALDKDVLVSLRDSCNDVLDGSISGELDLSYIEDLKGQYGEESLIVLDEDI